MKSWYRADLHIHTVLSACAELNMGPRDIVVAAGEKHLDIIAITDHNSAENARAVMLAAVGRDLLVIPGMEVATAEDVHLVCLFPKLESALAFQSFVYLHLPEGEYDESLYGPQIVCDEDENILHNERRLLAFSTTATMEQIFNAVSGQDGICYPAHVDRQAYSALHALGHIPVHIPFSVVEISHRMLVEEAVSRFPELQHYHIVTSSDAHDAKDIGKAITFFFLEKPTFAEVKMALAGQEGRMVSVMRPAIQVQTL
jgi:3',5'-nucleoside bisphosphate phosphatase